MIHFDYDKSDIQPDDKANLDRKAAILAANPSARIQIAGQLRRARLHRVQPGAGQPPRAGGEAVPRRQGRRRQPHRDGVVRLGAPGGAGLERGGVGPEPERPVPGHGRRLQPRFAAVRRAIAAACLAGVAACATPAQVQQVETQVNVLRADTRRSDSATAVQLRQILVLQQQMMDSLAATRRSLNEMKGSTANDLLAVQQQLLQLQELTGQSQRRLTDLRSQLEARGDDRGGAAPRPGRAHRRIRPAPAPARPRPRRSRCTMPRWRSCGGAAPPPAAPACGRCSRPIPKSELVPDALYFVGQSFSSENPDSASAYYRKVVKDYPTSSRAPAALYGLGLLAERRGDKAGARDAYNQLLKSYPKSDEAALARDRLKAIGR